MANSLICLFSVYFCLYSHQSHFVRSTSSHIELVSSLIVDVMRNDDEHSTLWLKSCWSRTEHLRFLKSTNRSYKLLQNALEADVDWTESQHFHHVWLAVDLNCPESIQFVMNTSDTHFGHPFRWILIHATDDIYDGLHLLADNNVIFAEFDEERNRYDLRQGNVSRRLLFMFGCFAFGFLVSTFQYQEKFGLNFSSEIQKK